MKDKNVIAKIKSIEMQLVVLKGYLRQEKKDGGLKSLKGIIKERFSEEEIRALEFKYK